MTQADVSEHEKVASQAFVFASDIGDPKAELPCEKVLGAFADDNKTLYADLELYERRCYYDGVLLSCAAIGGVAAKPEHRGKGAVKALFEAVFSGKKYDISILYPFSEPYYEKLGYGRAGLSLSLTAPFAALAGVKRNQDAVLYEGGDPARLLEIYNRCAKAYNLCFARDTAEAFSASPYLTQSYTYMWRDGAFATFSVDRAKSTVFVKELYFDSPEALRGMVGFLRNFEANQKTVCFQNLPQNTPVTGLVTDLKSCDLSLHLNGAARLLKPEAVLRAHTYPARDGGFTVRVGEETYRVTYSANGTAVQKTADAPDAVMDIPCASRLLLCGFADPAYEPGLEVKNPASDFFTAFPPKPTFFSDDL